jgi:TetR/AcrR family transcriptional regulator, regulator of cefoperazone and chloramphenicol sensitivity
MTFPEQPKPETDPTRRRVLLAAEGLFSERGFDGASVRAICDAAGANIAAVNYHFGDKAALYKACLREAVDCSVSGIPFPEMPSTMRAVDKLRLFIRTIMTRMYQIPRPSAMRLMMREMTEPSEVGLEAVNEFIRPMAEFLRVILEEYLPESISRNHVWMIGFSIVGQCLYYRQNRFIAEQLMGSEAFNALTLEHLIEHITRFTLAALGAAPPIIGTTSEPIS